MIRANAAKYPISAQCRILGVPRSTYYWMVEHPEVERADPIAGDVRAIWRDSRQRYGARKIKAALGRKGVTASRRRIGNIMREQGMTSSYARKTFKPHRTRADEAKLANLLDREFDGYAPRTHLASDLTYVRVGGGWAYVCLLVDLANRSIAGHSAGMSRGADLVMAAFATLDFPLTDVEVFRTDRGSEFDNAKIDGLLDVFGIRRSLSRKGNPYDNAVVESTNRLLKKELIYRNHYTTIEQLRGRSQRLCVVVRQPAAPLHPRIPEPEGIHRTGTRPLKNCPTRRCQSTAGTSPGEASSSPWRRVPRTGRRPRGARPSNRVRSCFV